jgi:hypothetical protein
MATLAAMVTKGPVATLVPMEPPATLVPPVPLALRDLLDLPARMLSIVLALVDPLPRSPRLKRGADLSEFETGNRMDFIKMFVFWIGSTKF